MEPSPGSLDGSRDEPTTAEVAHGDAGSEAVEGLEVDLLALAAIETALDEVEQALVRLDDGTYGRCEVCDSALDEADLVEVPMARHCPDHRPTPPA